MKIEGKPVKVRIKHQLALTHIKSAASHAREVFSIEARNPTVPEGESYARYTAASTGAVLSSVAYLEALINELYSTCVDGPHYVRNRMPELDDESVVALARLWSLQNSPIESSSTIAKYDAALAAARQKPIAENNHVRSSVRLLVELRNAFVHYHPEWSDHGTPESHGETARRFYRRLRNKVTPCPYYPETTAFFPDRCLGHGVAEWSVKAALEWTDLFFKNMGTSPLYKAEPWSIATRPSTAENQDVP